MNDLLIQLNDLWNSSNDDRFKGENPACIDVLEAIEEQFEDMTDDEIKVILDNLSEEQMEQLQSVFEDMVDDRLFMAEYLRNNEAR